MFLPTPWCIGQHLSRVTQSKLYTLRLRKALVHFYRNFIPFRFYLKLYFIRAQNYRPLQSPGRCPSSECCHFFLNSGHRSPLFPKAAARCVFIWPEAGLCGQDQSLPFPEDATLAVSGLYSRSSPPSQQWVNKANKTWTWSCFTTQNNEVDFQKFWRRTFTIFWCRISGFWADLNFSLKDPVSISWQAS